jgi:undecaprenyldiphospho-muramoylpentapeptide beta-N-acetylglucosaminyltransferase
MSPGSRDRGGGQRTWAVIAGGGTGGHVVPAIAIGQALVDRGHAPRSIHFVGSRRGLERTMVPAAGFEVTLLPGRGIARRFTWANVGAIIGLVSAAIRAVFLVARLRPAVVVAVGGYASAACVLAAVVWRIPLVIAEQNAVPGRVNQLAGRFARVCAVSFPGTPLPRAVLTGNPIRRQILSVDRSDVGRAAARVALGLPVDGVVVAAGGGSLGARSINRAVTGMATAWAGREGISLYHVTGERDFEEVSAAAPPPSPEGMLYRMVPFEQRMDLLLAAADVMVARSGASTVSELTAVGVPSILVPLPGAPGDHQTANARRLADAGAAVLIPDAKLDAGYLSSELARLVEDEAARRAMASAARELGRPGAADAVATLVEEQSRD